MSFEKFTMSPNRFRIDRFTHVFWDFDGVIKDSVEVKSNAFEALFRPHGAGLASRVREHHERNGGVSRYEKIPLYLGWAGVPVSIPVVEEYCRRFSELALQNVIESPWVPGVREYLEQHYERQYFVVVTATPQKEIEEILHRLGIGGYFHEAYGAPTSKSAAVGAVMLRSNVARDQVLMIGDAETDVTAARENGIAFLLRRTPLNRHLQAGDGLHLCDDFTPWAGVQARVATQEN